MNVSCGGSRSGSNSLPALNSTVRVSSLTSLLDVSIAPNQQTENGFRVHQFMIPGVDFAMFVGGRIPQGYEMFCTARSPEGFVLVSKEIDTRAVEYMVNAVRECRQH
jgi:hypothetical protein